MAEQVENGIAEEAIENTEQTVQAEQAAQVEGGIAEEEQPTAEGIAEQEPAKDTQDGGQSEQDEKLFDYELTASEDFPMPEDNLKSFSAACRNAKLTKEQAEKILDWHKGQYKDNQVFMSQQEKTILDKWNKEILADADFGGRNYKTTVADARRALAAFDTDGSLRTFLRESKQQYNPIVIRAVARVGRMMGEDKFTAQQSTGKEEKPLEERMYPNMKF